MAKVTQKSDLLTVIQVAELLGISPDTVRRWHKKGLIHASIGQGGTRLFSETEIRRVNSRTHGESESWKVLTASKTKLTSLELFCGAGGLGLGLHNAGFQNELLVDNDKDCIATINANGFIGTGVCESVRDLDLTQFAEKIDVMSGGFPCQAFSFAGMKRGFEDARGTLFYDFARLIEQVQPRMVIGENVRGLLAHDGGKTLAVMLRILENLGYRTAFKVLKAQFFDVPQKRERLLIFALREDELAPILFPLEKDYTISVRAAIEDAPSSPGMEYSAEKARIMRLIPEGGYWRDLPEDEKKKFMGKSFFLGGGKTGMARRLAWDEPSLTLTCNPAQKQTERCHPLETRPLSVREYARLQCFPDNWEFSGSISSQYRQIGNAVPVNLGYHIGLAARAILGHKARKAELPCKLDVNESAHLDLQLPLF